MVLAREARGPMGVTPEAVDFWERARQARHTAEATAESDPDAAASRAYYAAFYGVSCLFAVEGKSFTRHSALEVAVHRDLVKSGRWPRELGEAYAFVLRLRATGDYGGFPRNCRGTRDWWRTSMRTGMLSGSISTMPQRSWI